MLIGKSEQVNNRVFYQTLIGHTKDVVWLIDKLTKGPGFRLFCRRWSLNEQDLRLGLMAVAALHDFGKATRSFQEAIRKGKHLIDIPHALVALPVVNTIWQQLRLPIVWDRWCRIPIVELLVVISHHALLYDGLYQTSVSSSHALDFDPLAYEMLINLFSWIENVFGLSYFGGLERFSFEKLSGIKLGDCVRALKELQRQIQQKKFELKEDSSHIVSPHIVFLKVIYTFMLAYLKFSDYWASRMFSEYVKESEKEVFDELLPDLPPWQLPDDAVERVWSKLPKPYTFQKQLFKTEETEVAVIAPCGRGKTEGALLWFLHQRALGNCERLIIAMPTQVTSNAMRERLAGLFGEATVGLYHGRSFLEHRELVRLSLVQGGSDDLYPEVEYELAQSENFWSEVFAKPITVTTVDHLLFTFVHGYRQADFALGCLQTAALVFDEVHCYDRKMLAELRVLFELLRLMKIPHLIMSGTLPEVIVSETKIDGYKRIVDEEGLLYQPFILRKRDEQMFVKVEADGDSKLQPNESVVDEIVQGFKKGLRQFIIVNTVRKAQAIYRVLRERIGSEHLYCLHSRLCYIHRREKEYRIMEFLRKDIRPIVLVATQVIEVSLDISCDRMFTELAPIDALGQRAGRLNRGGVSPNGHELLVFNIQDPQPYCIPYGREPLPELKRTWDALQDGLLVSYGWLKQQCDNVYFDVSLGMAQLDRFFEACTLFGLNYDEIRFSEEEGKVYCPRHIVMPTVDVIPEVVLNELPDEGYLPNFLVPVPVWWLGKSNRESLGMFYTHKIGKKEWLICCLPYDPETGFAEEQLGLPLHGVIID